MSENSGNTATKSGYVAIIGKPNAGKSTLMNALVGAKLSIVTKKPQTTRKRVLGIYSTDTTQIVFLDTPGVLKPHYELQRSMMNYVSESIKDADVLLVIVDVTERKPLQYLTDDFIEAVKASKKPTVLVLNKMDALEDRAVALPLIERFNALGIFTEWVAISALKNKFVEDVVAAIEKHLPEGEFFYDADMLSTLPEKFFVAELIREKIFEQYKEEIPYSTEVNVIEFKERERGKWYISAEVIVERDSQKGIIIGSKGAALKQVGERARKGIEEHLQMPVFLELFVKVREDWRDNPNMLKSFGY